MLDVTFKEDENRTRRGYGAENLAFLRKLAFNSTEKEPSQGSKKGKRKKAGKDDNYPNCDSPGVDPQLFEIPPPIVEGGLCHYRPIMGMEIPTFQEGR